MENFLKKFKHIAMTNTWIVFLAIISLFVVKGGVLSIWYYVVVGGTFVLNLYKDKVRDKLKELESELDS